MTDEELVALKAQTIERVHLACLTINTLPSGGPRGFFTTWPLFKLDWYDLEEFGAERMPEAVATRFIQPPRFVATAKQIDDCLVALSLLDGFQSNGTIGGDVRLARRVIRHRAAQLWYGQHVKAGEAFEHYRGGWRGIGRLSRCSHTTARKIHAAAMHYAFERQIERNSASGRALSKSVA
jgi:hypothetical protein